MTGRDKNKILFCGFGTEETSVTLERGKIGRNDRGVGTAARMLRVCVRKKRKEG